MWDSCIRRAAPAPAEQERDRGLGLVEVVIAVVLVGLAMIPLMLAALTTVEASSMRRTATRVETVLANAADRVNRAGESCAGYDVYVKAAALAEGWESSQASASYQYYVPASSPTVAGTWQEGTCPGAVRPDGLLQLVTITVTSPDGKVSRTMEVVKSDV
ncbi:MAG TPA: hypothetical protein DCR14_00765 [Acidimicrobiaceae bacterium]|nr:hypothetical protein [Acidimicrobiaceae bacterium]